MEITYYVENYFQGYQSVSLDGWFLSWFNRETETYCCELATLGMDGVE